MGKPHRLANARIEIDTALPVERAIDVAKQAIGTQRALRITGEGEGVLRVQVMQGLISAPVMTFLVSATANGGRTRVVTAIDEYRTSQTTVYFVPVTSKSMEGVGVYRRFMVGFGQAMQASDPSAHIEMIERDLPGGAAPAPVVRSAPVPAPPAPVPAPPAPVPASLPVPLPGASVTENAPQPPAVAGVGSSAPPPESAVPASPPAAAASAAPALAVPVPPASVPPASSAPAPTTAAPLLSESNARIVQIVGGVILVAGLIFWYATPSNVTVGPLLVILLGAVVAGVGFIIGRNAGRAAADELAAKLRNERAMAGMSPTTPAVPMPASVPAVPMPATSAQAVPLPSGDPAVPYVEVAPVPGPVTPHASAILPVPLPAGAGVPRDPAITEDLEETRISPAPLQVGWQLLLPDGRRIAIASALRIGRDPVADPASPGAVLIPVDDAARSLSKTHAQLEAGPGVVIVTDLHSTNGTTVRTAAGGEVRLTAEIGHHITGDAEIGFGDYVVRLQQQGAR